MTGKFALFFLVAFCAMQGYEARSFEPELYSFIDDIIKYIQKLVEEVKSVINKILEHLKEVIKNSGIIEYIKAKIEEIRKELGLTVEQIKECLEKEKVPIEQLKNDTAEALGKCQESVRPQMEHMQAKADEVMKDEQKFITDCVEGVKKCKESYNMVTCMIQLVVTQLKEFKELEQEIKEASEIIAQDGKEIAEKLVPCVNDVKETAAASAKVIIHDFYECAKAIVKP